MPSSLGLAGLACVACFSAASAAAPEEEALTAALAEEETCSSSDECSLELRQLRGKRVVEYCTDYCKYEGSAVWQYDPNCYGCHTAAAENQTNQTAQATPSCVDYCKWVGHEVWHYDPLCTGCEATQLPVTPKAEAGTLGVTADCADWCMWTGPQVWQWEPECARCKLENPFVVAAGCEAHCYYVGPYAWGKDPGCVSCAGIASTSPSSLVEDMVEEEDRMEECQTAAMVGNWQAHAKLSFLKDPLQVDMVIKAADDSECPALTALLKVPGQEIHYDIRGVKEEGSKLMFKFQNNKDKAPYWHPGVFDSAASSLTEHLDTVGNVATGKLQKGTGGVLGMKEFKFHKV